MVWQSPQFESALRQYVQRAIERTLDEDLPPALSATDDPILAELWDHNEDAVYDEL